MYISLIQEKGCVTKELINESKAYYSPKMEGTSKRQLTPEVKKQDHDSEQRIPGDIEFPAAGP